MISLCQNFVEARDYDNDGVLRSIGSLAGEVVASERKLGCICVKLRVARCSWVVGSKRYGGR